jgi:pSer/pThr/pTyr-binding forkhead associated (FHA) protein
MTTPRTWLVGSAPDCDVVVARPSVSGHHCRLFQAPDGYIIEDLNSTNGTYVNGARIASPTRVRPTDAITLGVTVPFPWPDPGVRVIRIGTAPDNDVVLEGAVISGHHARIVVSAGMATIEDLGSTNGTSLNARENRVTRATIRESDTVYFGSVPVSAHRLLAGQEATRVAEAFPAPKATEDVPPVLEFRGAAMVLGRDADCDRSFDLPTVSGRHARLTRAGDRVLIEDLGSANGTFVNGKQIVRAVPVAAGDRIGLGSHTMTLAIPREKEKPEEIVDLSEADLIGPDLSRTALAGPGPPTAATRPRIADTPWLLQWWTLVRRIAGFKARDGWGTAILLAQAPLLAGAIVLLFGPQARAPVDAENWGRVARGVANVAFVTGLVAIWLGFSAGVREIAPRRSLYHRLVMIDLKPSAFLAATATVLGLACLVQCAVLWAIVAAGVGLKGPWPAALGVLALGTLVGLALGLLLSVLARDAGPLAAALPLAFLPVVFLGGATPRAPALPTPLREATILVPSRWTFEGLLLLESDRRPTWEEPAGERPESERLPRDMAESFFPADTDRMGVRAGVFAMVGMLIGLAGLTLAAFTAREAS